MRAYSANVAEAEPNIVKDYLLMDGDEFYETYGTEYYTGLADEVAEFFTKFMEDDPEIMMPMYRWESIVDAWGVWWEARRYEEIAA